MSEDVPEGGFAPLVNGMANTVGNAGAAGLGSVVRIPIPNSGGLVIQLRVPDFWKNFKGSSSVYITNNHKKTLRLDYGFNKATGMVQYHWNQKGLSQQFGINNHQPAGRGAAALHEAAKVYRWAGKVLIVAGLAADAYSIAVASNPIRRTVQVGSAWASAFAGCRIGGAAAAAGGSVVPALGTAAGGLGGCLVGGIIGYAFGERAGGAVYDWAEGTVFQIIPASAEPAYAISP